MNVTEAKAYEICHHIWKSINWDNIGASRRMGIYDEYTSKIKSASSNNSLSLFAERLSSKMGIRSIRYSKKILDIIEENNPEVLRLLREETQLIVLLMRDKIETMKEEKGLKEQIPTPEFEGDIDEIF